MDANFFEIQPMCSESLSDAWYGGHFRFSTLAPVVLDPRRLIAAPSAQELLRDTFALINEIQIDLLRQGLGLES